MHSTNACKHFGKSSQNESKSEQNPKPLCPISGRARAIRAQPLKYSHFSEKCQTQNEKHTCVEVSVLELWHDISKKNRPQMVPLGLGWAGPSPRAGLAPRPGLGWAGLAPCQGLGWAGLGWAHPLPRAGLGWARPCPGLGWARMPQKLASIPDIV